MVIPVKDFLANNVSYSLPPHRYSHPLPPNGGLFRLSPQEFLIFSFPPEGAGASAIKLLSRVQIRIRGRCGGQLRGESNFSFRSLHSGPHLHGNDGNAHWEPAQGTGGPVEDAPIRGGP